MIFKIYIEKKNKSIIYNGKYKSFYDFYNILYFGLSFNIKFQKNELN